MKQYLAGNIIDNFFDVFEKKSSRKNGHHKRGEQRIGKTGKYK